MNVHLSNVIAHRGAPLVAPENTLAAMQAAKNLGAQWIEFDVQLTADQQAVIIHDDRLNRTTNGKGKVVKTAYAELENLDAGSWFGEQFAGERIPTLLQYLRMAAKLALSINIELKVNARQADTVAEQVVSNLRQHWSHQLPAPLISSSTAACLQAMRQRDQHCYLGYIIDDWQADCFNILAANQCFSLHANYKILTAERIAAVQQAGYQVLAYTVNDQQIAQDLLSQGVSAVFSDNPTLLQ